ncbi:MAG TPA: hypothetical protein DIC18_02130 [Clostridiales bacterium]|nr:hypothetical protein [Clostridiales bacterium]
MRKSLGFEIFMTALVLVVIAGVAGALLGLVNHFTYISEEELFAGKATAVYSGELKKYELSGLNDEVEYSSGNILSVYVPTDPAQDTYVLVAEGEGAFKGTLRLLVNITDGAIVKIAKYEANETPGLGSKALDESYFKKFYGTTITKQFEGYAFEAQSANVSEIAAVTGATKSSTAVKNAVNAAIKWYQVRVLGGASV